MEKYGLIFCSVMFLATFYYLFWKGYRCIKKTNKSIEDDAKNHVLIKEEHKIIKEEHKIIKERIKITDDRVAEIEIRVKVLEDK